MGKRTSVFLFALVFIAGIYYLKVYQRPIQEQDFSFSREPASSRILPLTTGEIVNRLRLKDSSKETELTFERQPDGSWQIAQPLEYPAESVIVEGLVGLLKLTPRTRPLSFEGLEPAEFGFDKPSLSVCLQTNQTVRERCLHVGRDAALAPGAYAKWDDEPKYFLVGRQFLSAFDKTPYSVRKKQIFALLDQEVKSIRFKSQKYEVEIEHSGKNWTLRKPIQAILGPEAIHRLLTQLSGLYVKEFLDEKRWEDSSLGLKRGSRIVQIEFQDGSRQALTQGAEAIGRDAYYALGSVDHTVLLVSMGKLNKIEDAFASLTS